MTTFKTKHTYNERKAESQRIMTKYPDRIPIICEKNIKSHKTPDIDKTKYLVPHDLTVGHFLYVIRKRLKINQETAIFLFIENKGIIPSSISLITEIYNFHKDDDGFLYLTYSFENVFG